jgi:hypothetical protein
MDEMSVPMACTPNPDYSLHKNAQLFYTIDGSAMNAQ